MFSINILHLASKTHQENPRIMRIRTNVPLRNTS